MHIYKITNLVNEKIYVGLTSQKLQRRQAILQSEEGAALRAKIGAGNRGKVWWNNGVKQCRAKEQPGHDFVRGRIKK